MSDPKKSNRPTLASLSIDELAELPIAALYDMQADLEAEEKLLAGKIAKFHMVKMRKFSLAANTKFAEDDRESGIVRLPDGEYQAVVEFKKTVTWNQRELETLWNTIATSGEDPAVYMKHDFKISETAYNGWPENVRAAFSAARTVKPGKPDYRIEPVKGG